jgi:hypothetical protein
MMKSFLKTSNATGNNEENDEDGAAGNPEEYEPQVDFKPLVKLAEVEVRTGEEDEETLLKKRCKLYRFHAESKEWKEKGTGEIKILRHLHKEHSYRVLMRRDQVLKLCANHRISADDSTKLEIVNEKQVRWLAQDCSETGGVPTAELLAARFRNAEEALAFKAEFERIQQELKSVQATGVGHAAPTTASKPQTSAVTTGSLAALANKPAGSWTCTDCLANNKPEANVCPVCEAPRPKPQEAASNDGECFLVHIETKAMD